MEVSVSQNVGDSSRGELPIRRNTDNSTDEWGRSLEGLETTDTNDSLMILKDHKELNLKDYQHKDNMVDLSCGIGRLRTNILGAKFSNLYVFAACFGLSNFFTSMVGQVIQVQLTSLERQFNIDNARAGFLDTASRVGFMCTVLFAGHFAKKVHIPLVVGISGVIQGLVLTVPAILQFLDPYQLPDMPPLNSSNSSDTWDNRKYLCNKVNGTNGTDIVSNSTAEVKQLGFIIVLLVQAAKGVTDTFHSGFLPTLYMDDNMRDRSKMGILLGIWQVIADFSGPVGKQINGFLTTIPVDLKDTEMDPSDERFVSAWWLAFLIFGLGTAVFSLPVLLFPRSLISPEQRRVALYTASGTFTKGQIQTKLAEPDTNITENIADTRSSNLRSVLDETEESLIDSSEVLIKEVGDDRKKALKDLFKDFPKALVRVFRKPVFVLLLLDIMIVSVPVSGIALFRSSYTVYEYNVSMSEVALVTGITTAAGQILGSVISSWLSSKVSSKMGYVWIISASYFVTLAMTPLYLVFGCENQVVYGADGKHGSPVNQTGCDCPKNQPLISCGDDLNNYLSPCYAGCSDIHGKMFTSCSLLNSTKGGNVAPGLCPSGCHQNFVIYAILHGLQTFFSSLEMVPSRLLILRIVDPEDRGFATSFFMFSLVLVAIPAPNLFGGVIDGMCLIWDKKVCALYDRDKIRYLIAGIDIGVHACVQLTCLLMICVLKWEDRKTSKTVEFDPGKSAAEIPPDSLTS